MPPLGLRTPSAIAAAAPPAASSHQAAGLPPQLMFTSVLLISVEDSVYGPSVHTILFCGVLYSSTRYFLLSPRLLNVNLACGSSGTVATIWLVATSRNCTL